MRFDCSARHEFLPDCPTIETWPLRNIALPAPPDVHSFQWLLEPLSVPPEPLEHAVEPCIQRLRLLVAPPRPE